MGLDGTKRGSEALGKARGSSQGGVSLPFGRHFQAAAFDVEATSAMGSALERAPKMAGLIDSSHPLIELLAHKIMQLYRLGEHEPDTLGERALKELGVPFSGLE